MSPGALRYSALMNPLRATLRGALARLGREPPQAERRERLAIAVAVLASLVLLAFAVAQFITYLTNQELLTVPVGVDYRLHLDAVRRLLGGGTFYDPAQLAGPYTVAYPDILYPPPIIMILLPFLVLPAFLWWALPVLIVAAVVLHHRPAWHAWPVLAFCIWWPTTGVKILAGNPDMWITAALALGTLRPGFSPLVFLKPSLFPFALFGIRSRWWLGLAVLAVVSLAFLPMWPQYVTIALNARGQSVLYSLGEVPLLAIPLVAWAAQRDHRGRTI